MPARAAVARLRSELSGRALPVGERLPLASLRTVLDAESGGARWPTNPDGLIGRALLVPAGEVVTFPVRLGGEVSFTARAMLLPHDWGGGRGAIRARVAVSDPAGARHELWSGADPLR